MEGDGHDRRNIWQTDGWQSALLTLIALFIGLLAAPSALAEEAASADPTAELLALLQPLKPQSHALADDLWQHPELGFMEHEASARLASFLRKYDFQITSGVAGMPTAFVASYGNGKPVIGFLGEMDALPGESQAAVASEQIIAGQHGNHACGHNLFGPGSAAAAIAVSQWLRRSGRSGTVKFFATPAEEGGAGKVYLVRDGYFNDVDVALHWHPAGVNAAIPVSNNAVKSAKFRFRGVASHAASAPERGRSALDGVEAMNFMVNLMREHISPAARVHYIITQGGSAPNIVPDFAEVYYYAREQSVPALNALWARLERTAKAAADGTGTATTMEILHGTYNNLLNHTLKRILDENLRERAPHLSWTAQDKAFARAIYATFDDPWIDFDTATSVVPFAEMQVAGSSDVGDVSWVVPTADIVTATWAPSTDAHSWQATAASGADIGIKGMHLASEVLAMTAVDLLLNKDLVAQAKREFEKRRGADFEYRSLVGERSPPLDYRASQGTSQ